MTKFLQGTNTMGLRGWSHDFPNNSSYIRWQTANIILNFVKCYYLRKRLRYCTKF